ncbi:hypothetical protein L6452_03055 [Arctium lappa]|uniref:Uncharacterized protein n=1 Tax=Arctium lappa TaxID=4217 RepID=A0ACB9FKT3_ARCLA|nr:hypothetical protein L6452_03055 [Arctium lappa]
MRKKVKGDGFDSRFKHQTLVQNYLHLQKETEAARTKLEAMKLKKLTLQAQVRFLRRRHKFLLKNKSSTRHEQTIVKPQFVETTRYRKIMNEKVYSAALQNMNQNGKPYVQKKNVLLGIPSHMLLYGPMEDSLRRATQAYYSNQTVRTKLSDVFDSSKETPVKSRPPTFDLNQISREEEEEEELQEGNEPKDLVRSVIDEKLNDMKILSCGNVGRDASTSQARKRKISWQDPVALRV